METIRACVHIIFKNVEGGISETEDVFLSTHSISQKPDNQSYNNQNHHHTHRYLQHYIANVQPYALPRFPLYRLYLHNPC